MTPRLDSSRAAATHLGPEARRALRALLVRQHRVNAEQAVAHEETARELAGHTDADSVIERELGEVCAARCRDAVREAEHALERLEAGTYGSCEACGAAIPLERLLAIPETRRCVTCPSRRPGLHREPNPRLAEAQGW